MKLYNGDCLDVMPTLADNSVSMILTDPPYFKVKGDAWDRQWDKPEKFLAWLDDVLAEFHRVLKPNGSLYVFASPQMSARVELLVGERFEVLNRITWAKPEPTSEINKGAGNGGRISKQSLRRYYPNTESVIFAEHKNAESYAKGEAGYGAKCEEIRGFVFEPLRAWFESRKSAGSLTNKDINLALGTATNGSGMAGHYFKPSGCVQWELPTESHYGKLAAIYPDLFNRPYTELRTEYEHLRTEYEHLRRPFNATPDRPYTDVWTYKTVQAYPGKHPCEKPQEMLDHIIRTSTKPDAVVLDVFAGTGSTGIACQRLGRDFIGIEKDPDYYAKAKERIEGDVVQLGLAV